jgi:hypothetical protein
MVADREGGAPVGGGGGGGRAVDVGVNAGLARGLGGKRLSDDSYDMSPDERVELRLGSG